MDTPVRTRLGVVVVVIVVAVIDAGADQCRTDEGAVSRARAKFMTRPY
jgi:hypothetical protein